jgi:hypothetical protein
MILDVKAPEHSGSGLSGEGGNVCFAEFGCNAVIFEEEVKGVPDRDVPVAAMAVTVLDVVTVVRVEGLLVVVEAGLLESPVDEEVSKSLSLRLRLNLNLNLRELKMKRN